MFGDEKVKIWVFKLKDHYLNFALDSSKECMLHSYFQQNELVDALDVVRSLEPECEVSHHFFFLTCSNKLLFFTRQNTGSKSVYLDQ